MRLLLLFGVIFLGCSDANDRRGLTVRALRLDEEHVPLPFVIAIQNDSDSIAKIERVSVNVLSKTLISRSQDRIPDRFDYEVQFSDDHPTEIPANSEGSACGFLAWKLPPDPPPMIAVATCEFVVEVGGQTLAAEPVTLVLQSREGVVTEGEGPLAEQQAARIAEAVASLPGKKSPGFRELIKRLHPD